MKSDREKALLYILENAECNLSDDLQALGYLQDEYFIWNTPKDSYKYGYFEIQNALMILMKSMAYNRDYLRNCIKEYSNKKEE